ncbi:putative glycosyltransferase [Agrobacterium rubi TR3 = NBRC 13261]|uniref:Putative glycosyltransferase n=1 Tax=Agrobacterium rubi TR3 = NBRC 13261 TaxID=1368415 RepID=A0A081CX75_9HYPH|nr:glycosyltransferase family 4 protein [Agrobacterium rubi]MBP1879794.1 glycosyltransferase involved in cell wall biosynthesis [Agrobacterium rubi]MCL6654393.1 glycosyl transferase [Agrobacterium rubi]GAK71271.1 putative glycosyltransferase [Agrobacterium rubi TR3 = NBRC 13261]
MKIAFHAPLKSPNHPVPSGDRLMARMLMQAMRLSGHEVDVVSELRSFLREPDVEGLDTLKRTAEAERERIAATWAKDGKPDIWFCYHPYYKARDFLGPELCQHFGIAYVTAEASYSPKRNAMGWADIQVAILADLRFAAVNICFTERDRMGLSNADPSIRLAKLPPFIDTATFAKITPASTRYRLATVAMMRPGDKVSSYRALAEALKLVPKELPWTLEIIGDGPERKTVEGLFDAFDSDRIIWHGEQQAGTIAEILSQASLYVWPGHGEAYGLAYLEAQAAGLPVIAERIAGVPEVIKNGETGILTEPGNIKAYAYALVRLMRNDDLRQTMAQKARHFATAERSIEHAATTLNDILENLPERTS